MAMMNDVVFKNYFLCIVEAILQILAIKSKLDGYIFSTIKYKRYKGQNSVRYREIWCTW